MNKKYIILTVILALIIGAGVGYVLFKYGPNFQPSVNPITPAENQDNEEPQEQTLPYKYEYQQNPYEAGSLSSYDGQIIEINLQTKERKIIIPSVKAHYPPVIGYLSLSIVAEPKQSQHIYFTMIPNESDGFPFDLIKFDVTTKKLSKLKSSEYFTGYHPKAIDKLSSLIVTSYNPKNPADGRSLFLINLETDTVSPIQSLMSNQETLNSCWTNYCLPDFAGELSWIDKDHIKAAVYSASETTTDEWDNVVPRLIEKRKIKIN